MTSRDRESKAPGIHLIENDEFESMPIAMLAIPQIGGVDLWLPEVVNGSSSADDIVQSRTTCIQCWVLSFFVKASISVARSILDT